jgi:molybdate transport system substrate-binding protein
VLERLGIDKEMRPKTVFSKPGGDTALNVANGNAELGISQRQVLIPVPGIEVVGPLPGDLQSTNLFAVAVMNGARDAAAAKALVSFLRTPQAAEVIRAKGMDPAR